MTSEHDLETQLREQASAFADCQAAPPSEAWLRARVAQRRRRHQWSLAIGAALAGCLAVASRWMPTTVEEPREAIRIVDAEPPIGPAPAAATPESLANSFARLQEQVGGRGVPILVPTTGDRGTRRLVPGIYVPPPRRPVTQLDQLDPAQRHAVQRLLGPGRGADLEV